MDIGAGSFVIAHALTSKVATAAALIGDGSNLQENARPEHLLLRAGQ